MDFRCKGILYTGVKDTQYVSIYMLRKARRNLHFDPPKLDDPPPKSELMAPLYPLATAAVAVTTQLWPVYGR